MSMNFGIAEYWYDLYDFLLENTLHCQTIYVCLVFLEQINGEMEILKRRDVIAYK